MSKNITSSFPTSIDERLFFQDIDISQLETMNAYQGLISQGKYTEASTALNSSDLDFYGAWILNLLENRLYAIETYLLNREKPKLVVYSSVEPTPEAGLYENLETSTTDIVAQYESLVGTIESAETIKSSYRRGLSWIS